MNAKEILKGLIKKKIKEKVSNQNFEIRENESSISLYNKKLNIRGYVSVHEHNGRIGVDSDYRKMKKVKNLEVLENLANEAIYTIKFNYNRALREKAEEIFLDIVTMKLRNHNITEERDNSKYYFTKFITEVSVGVKTEERYRGTFCRIKRDKIILENILPEDTEILSTIINIYNEAESKVKEIENQNCLKC